MAAVNFDALADQILERVGGSTNITYLAHCMARLRMTLKDS
jgi:phosphotransferase system IIB component